MAIVKGFPKSVAVAFGMAIFIFIVLIVISQLKKRVPQIAQLLA